MAQGLTKPLTEMSTRNISLGVKAAGAYGWQPYHLMCRLSWNLGASTSWNPQGVSRPVMGLLYHYLLLRSRWVWGACNKILSRHNWNTVRKNHASANLTIISLSWTGPGSNQGLHGNIHAPLRTLITYLTENTRYSCANPRSPVCFLTSQGMQERW